uniref:Kappa-actitoxin-Bcs3a n=1 Tax=Bunodosoma caissarum TaxID=31165 RepID=K1B1_BUNCI|nr:RecName: Full=Kappa-actitoxin-Bcs3a; Short=Kappa-AITX-Bcs3a; AltName: Full=Potassium channel toxin BcsTx1; Short=BcsTx1 [Bunodosoma caissarum]
ACIDRFPTGTCKHVKKGGSCKNSQKYRINCAKTCGLCH